MFFPACDFWQSYNVAEAPDQMFPTINEEMFVIQAMMGGGDGVASTNNKFRTSLAPVFYYVYNVFRKVR